MLETPHVINQPAWPGEHTELADHKAAFDQFIQVQARQWISGLLGQQLPAQDLPHLLRSGSLLARVTAVLQARRRHQPLPDQVLEAAELTGYRPQQLLHAINSFFELCLALRVPRGSLFSAADVVDGGPRGATAVCRTLWALAECCAEAALPGVPPFAPGDALARLNWLMARSLLGGQAEAVDRDGLVQQRRQLFMHLAAPPSFLPNACVAPPSPASLAASAPPSPVDEQSYASSSSSWRAASEEDQDHPAERGGGGVRRRLAWWENMSCSGLQPTVSSNSLEGVGRASDAWHEVSLNDSEEEGFGSGARSGRRRAGLELRRSDVAVQLEPLLAQGAADIATRRARTPWRLRGRSQPVAKMLAAGVLRAGSLARARLPVPDQRPGNAALLHAPAPAALSSRGAAPSAQRRPGAAKAAAEDSQRSCTSGVQRGTTPAAPVTLVAGIQPPWEMPSAGGSGTAMATRSAVHGAGRDRASAPLQPPPVLLVSTPVFDAGSSARAPAAPQGLRAQAAPAKLLTEPAPRTRTEVQLPPAPRVPVEAAAAPELLDSACAEEWSPHVSAKVQPRKGYLAPAAHTLPAQAAISVPQAAAAQEPGLLGQPAGFTNAPVDYNASGARHGSQPLALFYDSGSSDDESN